MRKFLSGSAGTGSQIMSNENLFSYEFENSESSSDGSTTYNFNWTFNGQSGYITITVKEQKISQGSSIGTNPDSIQKFPRPLGLNNDNSLYKVFNKILQDTVKVCVNGTYSAVF